MIKQTTGRKTETEAADRGQANRPVKEPMDKLLLLLTVLLLGVGIVTVFDASYVMGKSGDLFHYVRLQVGWALLGIGALVITWRVPYWAWRRYAVSGVFVTALMLVAVKIPFIGHSAKGSGRWIGFPAFHVQPSEIAKLVLVVYLARVLAVSPKTLLRFRQGIAPPLAVIVLFSVMVALEPDMGTALLLMATGLTLLFLAGARPKHLAAICLPVAGLATVYAVISSYRLHRLLNFLYPESDTRNSGYQVWQGLIAMGSGGLVGRGLGEGRGKLYIPESHTDFIFPVFGEEWGLIGTLSLVTVFLLMAMRGYSIAHRCKDPFGALLAAGLTTVISLQAVVNMAVATSSIPNTGVPLPFISYGGASLVLTLAAVGILLNISSYPGGPGRAEKPRVEPNEQDWERRWGRPAYLREPLVAPTAAPKRKPRPKAKV